MVKLKDDKGCHCGDHGDASLVQKLCRSGYCTIWYCPWCDLQYMEAGPVACPHKKNENGTLRWYKYPDMDAKIHPAVKENKAMRKQKHRKVRK